MRITDKGASVLIDLPLLQASRLQDRYFMQALAQGAFDPYPDGTQATGPQERRGALARNSGVTETELSGAALTGFEGALPDHLQEALQTGLQADDTGFKDFLAIFDKRLMALDIRTRRAAVLVATQDAQGREAASILSRMLRLLKQDGSDTRHLKLMFPLLSRVRSLQGLRAIVEWWTGRSANVTVSFDTLHPIDEDCRTRLSARPLPSTALGQGALLGRFGRTPMGRISISIACKDRADLDGLLTDDTMLAELRAIVAQFLRDPVPVTFYADVTRKLLNAPRLSARKGRGDRLGAYTILEPHKAPDAVTAIKLTQIKA